MLFFGFSAKSHIFIQYNMMSTSPKTFQELIKLDYPSINNTSDFPSNSEQRSEVAVRNTTICINPAISCCNPSLLPVFEIVAKKRRQGKNSRAAPQRSRAKKEKATKSDCSCDVATGNDLSKENEQKEQNVLQRRKSSTRKRLPTENIENTSNKKNSSCRKVWTSLCLGMICWMLQQLLTDAKLNA